MLYQKQYKPYDFETIEEISDVWLRYKKDKYLTKITSFSKSNVITAYSTYTYKQLYNQFETKDGRPVGKLIE